MHLNWNICVPEDSDEDEMDNEGPQVEREEWMLLSELLQTNQSGEDNEDATENLEH